MGRKHLEKKLTKVQLRLNGMETERVELEGTPEDVAALRATDFGL